jgi:hypothetical protein
MKKEIKNWQRVVLWIVLIILFFFLVSYGRYGDTYFEALNHWIDKHGEETETFWYEPDLGWYVEFENGQWFKLNFEKDFFGDWDVKEEKIGGTPEEIAETLYIWYKEKEITAEGIEDLLKMFEKKGINSNIIRSILKEKGVPIDEENNNEKG